MTACLGCSAALPPPFLDLGHTPLANAYVPADKRPEAEPVFPLRVSFCPSCYLVQLIDRVDPAALFEHYLYFSSYSDSYLRHASDMADDMIRRFGLTAESRVLELASNDGYLLRYFQAAGIPVLGIEPAKNIAAAAQAAGIPTLNIFFGQPTAPDVIRQFGLADLVLGNNVLAHVPEINGFLRAVESCLKPGGRAVFEFPDAAEMLERVEFDTIYHEHVFYYSLSAISVLAERNGLTVLDVQPQRVHGGSLRTTLGRPSELQASPAVAKRLDMERQLGLCTPETYSGFAQAVATLRERLLTLVQGLWQQGRRLGAYGAPAKGNTLLNYCGLKSDTIEFTVDRSSHKQGMFLPGSGIPILGPEELVRRRPDYCLLLPWNIKDEILAQQQEFLEGGGQFIIPVPAPIVTGQPSAAGMKVSRK